MTTQSRPIELVLVGGGHAHALLLHRWISHKLPSNVGVVLISSEALTPYSGMVPGYVAGTYRRDDAFIDLIALAGRAGVAFRQDRVVGVDLPGRRLRLAEGTGIGYDFLSLNLGVRITPPDELAEAVPVKPIDGFLTDWHEMLAHPGYKWILIAGGGAAGCELALAMRHYMGDRGSVVVIEARSDILADRPVSLRRRMYREFIRAGIATYRADRVVAYRDGQAWLASGAVLACDRLFWAGGGQPFDWPGRDGLATDDRGFILVDGNLRSISHPEILACGDIATIQHHAADKAGVYAVRHGEVLQNGLPILLNGGSFPSYRPQRYWLSLLNLGNGRAVASWGRWALTGPAIVERIIWYWKDWLDRRFMARFL